MRSQVSRWADPILLYESPGSRVRPRPRDTAKKTRPDLGSSVGEPSTAPLRTGLVPERSDFFDGDAPGLLPKNWST